MLAVISTSLTANLCAASNPKVEFYVATNGSDAWGGRLAAPNKEKTDGPFATLERARDAIRELKKQSRLPGPIAVYLREGTYFLDRPFVLTPADSGTKAYPITYTAYRNEKAVISGGRAISGFREVEVNGKKMVAADVPEVKDGEWNFTQLFVDDRRASRTRLPAQGLFQIEEVPDLKEGDSFGVGQDRFRYHPGDLKPWHNLTDVDIVVLNFWIEARMQLASLDEATRTAHLNKKSTFRLTDGWKSAGAFYFVENVFEELKSPGRFYLDRPEGILYYCPAVGEGVKSETFVAPRLEQLVRFEGDAGKGRYVEHIVFSNLRFAHTEHHLPPDSAGSLQAACFVPAAIYYEGARKCSVTNCEIARIGNYAIEIGPGCEDNSIERNSIHDLGAGGVKVATGSRRTTIADNDIGDGGKIFMSAVGVWVQDSPENKVIHNHIHDLYYTGVSVGWVWGYGESKAVNNLVEKNHIHHIGRGVLSDLGGIYTLGVSPGTKLGNNLIHDCVSFSYGGWGIYNDEGSTDILVENNVVYRTKTGGYHQHYGKENIIRNNIFAFSDEGQLVRSREEEHLSFIFERNIVYFSKGKLLSSNWNNERFKMDYNLYWHSGGDSIDFSGASFEEWRKRGHDTHSVIADPKFVDAAGYDFTLKPDSPAFKLRFKQIDISDVGPRAAVGPQGRAIGSGTESPQRNLSASCLTRHGVYAAPSVSTGRRSAMFPKLISVLVVLSFISLLAAHAGGGLGNLGTFRKWHKVEIILKGPATSVTADPNPFLIPVDVTFTGPGGTFTVPAFYDGDGKGGGKGNVWKVRFCPNALGKWTFVTSSADPKLRGHKGSFTVDKAPCSAPRLLKLGRLEYVGGHYLKFADGPYWIKGGIDGPENFLGRPFGDWEGKKAAIDLLNSRGVNSVYIMMNTIDPGDGKDVWPWLGGTQDEAKANSSRFDVRRMSDWEDFFTYCERKGIVLHLLFDDDSAWKDYDHDLYYREMIARFGHHPAIIWNIGEEADENYTDVEQLSFARTIRRLDPYDHPLTVHRTSGSGSNWPFIGSPSFDLTSIQVGSGGDPFSTATLDIMNAVIIGNRNGSVSAGRPIPVMIDETAKVDVVNSTTRLKMRGEVLYPIFLGGGNYEMLYQDQWTMGGRITYEILAPMLDDMRIAREFVEALPFHEMEPRNALLSDTNGNFCLAKPGEAYGIYLRDGGEIRLDLTGAVGAYQVKWHNVTTGESADGPVILGGGSRSLGHPAYPGDVACSVTRTAVFPGASWQEADPASLGLDAGKLKQFAESVGGSGVIIKDGFLVYKWGETKKKVSWASASKPVTSTALFLAVSEGRTTLDTPLATCWPEAKGKDRNITFRHLANMTSGYRRPEDPGKAWSYNDTAIGLYRHTLYDKVFGQSAQEAMSARMAPLQFEDAPSFDGVFSPRDFARMGWLWLNKGKWGGVQIVPEEFFDKYCKVHVPVGMPRSDEQAGDTEDYLHAFAGGGGTNQTPYGPGEYGFCWWFNENSFWPDAPRDTFQANGHAGDEVMTVMPSLGIVAASDGRWGGPPDSDGRGMNENLKLLKESVVNLANRTSGP